MPISVGITDNIVISSVSKNDRGTLIIKLKEAGEIDPLTALNTAGSTQFNQAEKDMMIYPPSATTFSGETDTFENVLKKIAEVKDPLNHILQAYTTNANIKWDIFAGTGITKDNMQSKLIKQETVDAIYANIVNQFISMMSQFTGDNGKKQRVMLIRQSAAKHYPAFRKRFLESYPFIEPMDIPKESSKLKFSKFEIDNKLNSGEPVGGQQQVSEEEKNSVETLFTTN